MTRGHAIATVTTDDGDVRLARAELIDASIRGLGVRLNQAAPTGSRIKLYFHGEVTPGQHGCGVALRRVERRLDRGRGLRSEARGVNALYLT